MMIVRIVKDWDYPKDFFKQLPGNSQSWGDVQFTEEEIEKCDYLICLQRPKVNIKVECPVGNAWIISQEPPVDWYKWHQKSYRYFDRVYTYYNYDQPNFISSLQPVLPWHIDKSYDFLNDLTVSDLTQKESKLVWVTSNKSGWPGQKARMRLKEEILKGQEIKQFELYGVGFEEVDDKYDVLFPSKYGLAIENYSVANYWTEKYMDCILSWTLPFYWGAPNLDKYFPAESFIQIDIENPKSAIETIRKTMDNGEWEKRLDAIAEARDLILNKYQFFPFMAQMISDHSKNNFVEERRLLKVPRNSFPKQKQVKNTVKYYQNRITQIFK